MAVRKEASDLNPTAANPGRHSNSISNHTQHVSKIAELTYTRTITKGQPVYCDKCDYTCIQSSSLLFLFMYDLHSYICSVVKALMVVITLLLQTVDGCTCRIMYNR